ncbi:MAG: hypothetical protein IPK10_02595 [Bacteroidetes bacterium]|nr:hypothetical protein [Bacteroidota bacterium]
MSKVKFEKEELDLLIRPEFFLMKKRLEVKINDLLTLCIPVIQEELERNSSVIPQNSLDSTPKISRGENYLSFPWQILDYPRLFGKQHAFALRTLCWFGNGISVSLYLSGDIAKKYSTALANNFSVLAKNDFYICIHKDPFQHHFEEDNIIPCRQFMESGKSIHILVENHHFIKIVKLFSFEEIDFLPKKMGEASRILLEVISEK